MCCFLQPALSVPIHVVELMNVPAELRLNKAGTSKLSQQFSDQQSYSPLSDTDTKDQVDETVRFFCFFLSFFLSTSSYICCLCSHIFLAGQREVGNMGHGIFPNDYGSRSAMVGGLKTLRKQKRRKCLN